MSSVTPCEYMDSERHSYLNTNGGHKLFKVNKRSNQPAADRADDNDPSEWNRISITWEKTSSNCNVVPSL